MLLNTEMSQYVISVAVVVVCTAIAIPLRTRFDELTFAMLYLLGVIAVSMRCRRGAAVLNALLSVTAFYYFFAPYRDSVVADSDYLITLIAMLFVALVISTLTFK